MFSLQNKKVAITGAASGIGKEMALLFAQQGAWVHVLDQNTNTTNEVVEHIQKTGGKASAHTCNVANYEQVVLVFETIKNVDILVNNAGVAHVGTILDCDPEQLDHVLTINVKGYYHTIKAALPAMIAQGAGVILNIASVSALVGIPERFAYSTSKGAVIALTQSVAKDFVKKGIRCNSISPARVHTPFVDGYLEKLYPNNKDEMFERLSQTQPIGRMAKPVEIAQLALYLCSDEASFLTGTDYPIDGGFVKLNN
jgi:2-keto-3-deoxy-L-fuconate dehydrogenase